MPAPASSCFLYLIIAGVAPAWDFRCWVCQLMSQFATILAVLGTGWICILILLKSLDLNPC